MKKIIYIIFPLVTFFALILKVDAAASLNAPSSVTNGSSFTVSVNLSGVAAWEVHVSASGPVSGCVINAADSDGNAQNTSKNYSATCRATGTGTIKISLSGNNTTEAGHKSNISGTRTVNVVAKSSNNSSNNSSKNPIKNNSNKNTTNNKNDNKSADNTLKSLSVEGQNFDFNKDTTTYNLSVGNDVKKIKIKAEASNAKATITGTGEKDIKEGENKFDIIVTAENGDTKTYTINVTVDAKPITITVNGKNYTLIKKKEELPELNIEHEDIILNFDGQEIPAYRIDKLNYVLLALKDKEGNIKLYKYDSYKDGEKPDEYTLFIPFVLPQFLVSYLDFPKDLIPEGYKKYKEKINGEKVTVYKLSKDSDYCLFYGINIENGEKNIYKYDSKEQTFQIYDNEETKTQKKQIEKLEMALVGAIGVFALLLLVIFIQMGSKGRFKRKVIKKLKEKENGLL